MLKVDFERTEIKGSEPHILTEFTILARNLRKLLAKGQSTEYEQMQRLQGLLNCQKKHQMRIDEEVLNPINELGKMLARSLFRRIVKKENDDKEPSTGNSDFDDFLKDLFGGGAK